MLHRIVATTAILFLIVGLAVAQNTPPTVLPKVPGDADAPPDTGVKLQDPPPREVGTPAPPGSLKDPTTPSPRMRDALATKSTGPGAPGISPLALRGRVLVKDKPPLALLEVDGKLYRVSKDSVVAGPNKTILRVLDVNSSEVRIQIDPLKEIVVLR
jgi:hypothetical protein